MADEYGHYRDEKGNFRERLSHDSVENMR